MMKLYLVAIVCVLSQAVFGYEIAETSQIRPRKNAPTFKAKAVFNDKFVDVSLQQYIAEGKWSVLLFYPFDYTFVCPVCSCD